MLRYEITFDTAEGTRATEPIDAPTVASSIEKLHKLLQRKHNLLPTQYKIVELVHVYGADVGNTEMIRSKYPVPGGPNPDFRSEKQKEPNHHGS